jgi:hypothetical protein
MTMPRRRLLQTLSLGTVAPFLEPLVHRVEAEIAGQRPMRFVFFLEGNGVYPCHIQPKGITRILGPKTSSAPVYNAAEEAIDQPLSAPGVSLPDPIAPLARHLERLTIVQGLSGRVCGGGHFNAFGALGAYPQIGGARDITIDCALAKTSPSINEHVALGFVNNPTPSSPPMFTACSATAPNTKLPHYQDPVLAWNMLFGTITGGNQQAEVGSQQMLLDHMSADIARLVKQLPGEEAEKAQRYADAFAAIAKRQARLGEIDPEKIPPRNDKLLGSMKETDRMKAHVDIAATALITGLTNTVTLCSGAASYPQWAGLGATLDNHALAHQAGTNVNEIAQNEAGLMRVKIRQFNTELVASLVDQLEAIPEGNGTMMDNTLIVYLSDSAEEHHCICYEWPVFMLGNLGGRLKAGNRFLNVTKYGHPDHPTMAQFFMALLEAAGRPVKQFGVKDQRLMKEFGASQDGPWQAILA